MEDLDFIKKAASLEKDKLERLLAYLTGYYSNEKDHLNFKNVTLRYITEDLRMELEEL